MRIFTHFQFALLYAGWVAPMLLFAHAEAVLVCACLALKALAQSGVKVVAPYAQKYSHKELFKNYVVRPIIRKVGFNIFTLHSAVLSIVVLKVFEGFIISAFSNFAVTDFFTECIVTPVVCITLNRFKCSALTFSMCVNTIMVARMMWWVTVNIVVKLMAFSLGDIANKFHFNKIVFLVNTVSMLAFMYRMYATHKQITVEIKNARAEAMRFNSAALSKKMELKDLNKKIAAAQEVLCDLNKKIEEGTLLVNACKDGDGGNPALI